MKTFWNDEAGFRSWIERHSEDGYLLNCVKGADRSVGWPYILHRADCVRFTTPNRRSGKNFTTRKYYKVCATNMSELASWARQQRREKIPKCKLCQPT